MNHLLKFYEQELLADNFYQFLGTKINESPNLFNSYPLFLGDYEQAVELNQVEANPIVENGDIRFDMPILLGNQHAKERIMLLGLEPRHTDDFYNILKIKNRVFGTPFGIDRWYSKSKQNIYASAFKDFFTNDRLFLFSDFVKEYNVLDPNLKGQNDQFARENFQHLFAKKYQDLLEKEISIFQPTLIIGLGKIDIQKKIPREFIKEHSIRVIPHPTNGNYNRMITALSELLK